MSDKTTLGKARGLNSIADPKQFKGSAGRAKLARPKDEPDTAPAPPPPPVADTPPQPAPPTARRAPADEPAPAPPPPDAESSAVAPTRKRAARKAPAKERTAPADRATATTTTTPAASSTPSATELRTAPHRAVQPGVQRKRRELSIPHPVAEALEATGINPADVVMAGYRNHGDAIYAGAGGRLAARGRTRLRLSISDTEFEQITRLGLARGWNRSETVSVILTMELEARATNN